MKFKSHNGATVLEFAIILPVLLMLILAIIEFSFLLFNKQVITNAAREGARAGIVQRIQRVPASGSGSIEEAVDNYCFNHLITWGGPTTPTVTSTAPCPTGAYSATDLTVTVNFHYNYLALPTFIAGLIGGTELQAEAVMKCE